METANQALSVVTDAVANGEAQGIIAQQQEALRTLIDRDKACGQSEREVLVAGTKRREIVNQEAERIIRRVGAARQDAAKLVSEAQPQLASLSLPQHFLAAAAPPPVPRDDPGAHMEASLVRAKDAKERLDNAVHLLRVRQGQRAEFRHRVALAILFVALLGGNYFFGFWKLLLQLPLLAGLIAGLLFRFGPQAVPGAYSRLRSWAKEVQDPESASGAVQVLYGKWYYKVLAVPVTLASSNDGGELALEVAGVVFLLNLTTMMVMGVLGWFIEPPFLYGGAGLGILVMLLPVWRARQQRKAALAVAHH